MDKNANYICNEVFCQMVEESLIKENSFEKLIKEDNCFDLTGFSEDEEREYFLIRPQEPKLLTVRYLQNIIDHRRNGNRVNKFTVISNKVLDEKDDAYIRFIRNEYRLNISFRIYDIEKEKLLDSV